MDRIRDELEELEVQNYEQKAFVTQDTLKSLFDEKRVTAIITDLSDTGKIQIYQQEEIVKAILANGRKIFATLISLSRPELILKFIEADHFAGGQLDSKLPFSREAVGHILEDEKLSTRFEKHQWKFFLPFFRADQSHRELRASTRLPFVRCEQLGEGGFGEVYKMILPASCQALVPGAEGEVCIVRKQIKRKGDAMSDYQREQHILSMLRCLSHPNIVNLLTAYTINQTHNFLFPLADGDLKGLFRQNSRPLGLETENSFFQALHELASAIEAVHHYFSEKFSIRKIGCHYDLKPDNILYRSGKFILSDFGLSRLSEEDDESDSLYRNGAKDYWAPECLSLQEGFQRRPIGRSSDLWSFGCILLEMLTYLQQGPSAVKTFSERRIIDLTSFWTCRVFHNDDKPHDGVVEWISILRHTAPTAQNELLTVIQDLLQIKPSERPKAKDITLDLFHIAQHELYTLIDLLFHKVLVIPDLEFQVEYERFQLWGEKTGIKVDLRRFRALKNSSESHFETLQTVRKELLKLREEIESLLESKGPRTFRLHYHVQKVIDKLWDMQSTQTRLSMANQLEIRVLSVDDRVQLGAIEAVFSPTESTADNSMTKSRSAAHRRIGLLAAMKQISLALNNRTQSLKDLLLEEQQISNPLQEFHWHYTGIYEPPDGANTQVFVERLVYHESWSGRVDELIQRVENIASICTITSTSLTFPVLTCIGFYHNLGKRVFDIVYKFPPRPVSLLSSIPDMETPMSLRAIFSKLRQRRERPSLDQIFAIALQLINFVMTMHKANWLHKNISSYNIIFFPDRFTSIADSMSSPFFIGFNYSRLNLETEFTQFLSFTQEHSEQLDYHHPIYQRARDRYRQEFDYYSIGIVLLELGFWLPIKQIIRDIRGSPQQVLEILLEEYLPSLRSFMGTAYAEAVEACLRVDFGDSSNLVEVQETFERKVLQKIRNREII